MNDALHRGLIIALAFLAIPDGAGSIWKYRYQSLIEHAIRVLRIGVGFGIIYVETQRPLESIGLTIAGSALGILIAYADVGAKLRKVLHV